ncbi:hypothetical protein B0J13DRAFT_612895 [Dactylonectria estremocensis]|uniref:Fungal N-terminal domain-containing protein n=1 Tax=Dactylonectria estremocensis TaxID=1079267 RepID=A0A9P9DI19_9HYPO|nr:hypothetical protein B0J13DRAFT_612895 [Dactylonectria estremocensis]
MDPPSITVGCLGLIDAIHKTSSLITRFVVDCKDARGDLRAVILELSDLTLTVHLLQDIVSHDGKATSKGSIPSSLETDIRGIIDNCLGVARDIEEVLAEYTSGKLAPTRWAIRGKERVATLKTLLGAHRQALNLAVDTITLSITKGIKDTGQIVNDTADIKEDTNKILDEIARLESLIISNDLAGTVCDDLSRPGSPAEFSLAPPALPESPHPPMEKLPERADANKEIDTLAASFRDSANISDPEKNPRNPGMSNQDVSAAATHQLGRPEPLRGGPNTSYKMNLVAENVGPFPGQMLAVSLDGTTAFSWDESKRVVMIQDVVSARVRGTWKPWRSLSLFFNPFSNSRKGEVVPLSRNGSLMLLVQHPKKEKDGCKLRAYDWVLEAEVQSLDLNAHFILDYFPKDGNRVLFLTWKVNGGLDLIQVERIIAGGGYAHDIRTGTLPDDKKGLSSGYPWAMTFSLTGQRIVRVSLTEAEAWADVWDIGPDPLPKNDGRVRITARSRVNLKRKEFWMAKPYQPHQPFNDTWPCVECSKDLLVMVGCTYDEATDREDWFVTGWNLVSGEILFNHSLGKWPPALVFRASLSVDCKRLKVLRWTRFENENVFDRANVDSEWALTGDWENYELLELDGLRTIERWRGLTEFTPDFDIALNQSRKGDASSWHVYKLVRNRV